MRKTNSKEVRERVKAYILRCEEVDDLREVKDRFINEYSYMIKRVGETNACIEWLRGLAIGCDFYYCDIIKRLAMWLDDTIENQEKRLDKKGDYLYWYLLAREIVNAK